jgi:hypothetical protein
VGSGFGRDPWHAHDVSNSTADPRHSKRLAIVVPDRDRAEHLAKFVPHVAAYFERDKSTGRSPSPSTSSSSGEARRSAAAG